MELAADFQDRQVRLHVEFMGGVGAVEQEIKLELVRLRPLLVVGCDNDFLRAELLGVCGLVLGVRQRVGVGAQGARPLDG